MSYCDVTDIEQEMQLTISIDGRPNRADVTEIIAEVSSDLDGIAQAAGYTVPVTSESAARVMKRYTRLCTAAQVWNSGFISMAPPVRLEYWEGQCEGFKERLRKGEQYLPGLTPESDLDPAFGIATFPNRDRYWQTRTLDEEA